MEKRFALRLGLVAVAALGLRAANVLLIGQGNDGAFRGDITYFHEIAGLIAAGEGYINPRELDRGEMVPSAEHPPLWPLVLAAVSKLGFTSPEAHRLAGCLIGSGAVVLVGLLARRVDGDRTGLIAALLAALYPAFVAADGSLMSETLYGALLIAALLAALWLLRDRSVPRAALLGVAIGLAALVRAEALLLLLLLVLPIAWGAEGRRRLAVGGAALAAAALVLAPWAVRNWSAFDRPVLVSTNDGTVLAGANCDLTYAGADLGFWRDACFTPITSSNEAIQSARWRADGLEYAGERPVRLVTVVVPVRLLRTFGFWQPRREALLQEGRNVTLSRAGQAIYYFALLPLALVGGLGLRRRRRAELLVLLAPIAMVALTTALTLGQARFRHAAELALVVLAAAGVSAALRRWGARND